LRDANSLWARSQQIIDSLSSHEFTPRQKLADSFELSVRQVSRIISHLQDAGYQIEVSHKGYRLLDCPSTIPLDLTPGEVCALLMVSQLTKSGLDAEPRTLWQSVITKIRKRLSTSSQSVLARLEVHRTVAPTNESHALGSGFMAIEESLTKRLQLRLAYQGIEDAEPRWRQVEPLGLFHTGRAWYLEAFDLESFQQKTFRLSRVSQATVLGLPIIESQGLPSRAPGFHRWSLNGGPKYQIQIELNAKLARWFRENPIHPLQQLDKNRLSFEATDLPRVADWLLSLRGARIVAPVELSDCVKLRLQELILEHGDIRCPHVS